MRGPEDEESSCGLRYLKVRECALILPMLLPIFRVFSQSVFDVMSISKQFTTAWTPTPLKPRGHVTRYCLGESSAGASEKWSAPR